VVAYLGTQDIVHGAVGDGPTDYVSAAHIKTPREAVRAIGRRWFEASGFLARGEDPPDIRIGSPESRRALAPLLKSRAELLLEWVEEDSLWV
jgi:hypothetical protein